MSRRHLLTFALATLLVSACSKKIDPTSTAASASAAPIWPQVEDDASVDKNAEPETPKDEAAKVTNQLRPRFRDCYQHSLAKDPTLQGSVTMVANVGADGRVVSSDPENLKGLNAEVVECLRDIVMSARFSPPADGTMVFKIPIRFVSQ